MMAKGMQYREAVAKAKKYCSPLDKQNSEHAPVSVGPATMAEGICIKKETEQRKTKIIVQ